MSYSMRHGARTSLVPSHPHYDLIRCPQPSYSPTHKPKAASFGIRSKDHLTVFALRAGVSEWAGMVITMRKTHGPALGWLPRWHGIHTAKRFDFRGEKGNFALFTFFSDPTSKGGWEWWKSLLVKKGEQSTWFSLFTLSLGFFL